MIKIDGIWFEVPEVSLNRRAEFLDRYAGRTEDGVLHRELIGVYYNYQLKLGAARYGEEYDRLWRKLTQPQAFHTVTVPGVGGDYTFEAYFADIKDSLLHTGDENHWTGLTVSFIAREPARR